MSATVLSLFILANLSVAAREGLDGAPRLAKTHLALLELHAAPNPMDPTQGLRESAPEEMQRLEYRGVRGNLARSDDFSKGFRTIYAGTNGDRHLCSPRFALLSICRTARVSLLAQRFLPARYPIPPPD